MKEKIKDKLYIYYRYWHKIFAILFNFKPCLYILCEPVHPNLGDQAQYMCTVKLLKQIYPQYSIIDLGVFADPLNLTNKRFSISNILSFYLLYGVLKLKVKTNDIFVGHSGYFMTDHHAGWKMFTDMMRYFPKIKIVILPQTVNFFEPVIKKFVSKTITQHKGCVLFCRDKVSLEKAKELFPGTKTYLYPDIVTSLIGSKTFKSERKGILFIMRNDIERYYSQEKINELKNQFEGEEIKQVDTTIKGLSTRVLDKEREKIIFDEIKMISQYKLVVTDRYHGTIFSVIAGTPVVVIGSADHKLESGVKWFPQELFSNKIRFAEDIENVHSEAQDLLAKGDYTTPVAYFKENYWDKIEELLK